MHTAPPYTLSHHRTHTAEPRRMAVVQAATPPMNKNNGRTNAHTGEARRQNKNAKIKAVNTNKNGTAREPCGAGKHIMIALEDDRQRLRRLRRTSSQQSDPWVRPLMGTRLEWVGMSRHLRPWARPMGNPISHR